MEEMIYLGYQYGRFQDQRSLEWRSYCSAFFISDFRGQQDADHHFGGKKAEKFSCVSPDVFSGLEPNTPVRVVFGRNNIVTAIDPA